VARPEADARGEHRAEDVVEAAERDQLADVARHVDADLGAGAPGREPQPRERVDLPELGHLLVRPPAAAKLIGREKLGA
jgi:hypothetical protein